MESRTTSDGVSVLVSTEEWEVGSKGPFFIVYRSEADERYGFLCSNCDTFDNTMDTMGRIVCNKCGNTRKADEWDAAHE